MNADGSDERQVTRTRADSNAPSWSPDSTKLALHSNRSGGSKILLVNVDGTGLAQITGGSGFGDYVPQWQRVAPPLATTTTVAPPTTRPPRAPTRRR